MLFGESLVVREYAVTVPRLDRAAHGLRIAQVSDFHFRRWNVVLEQARARLMVQDYDLLAATGDFCSVPGKWRIAANLCRRFFDGIAPPLGIQAVLGNHDGARLAHQPDMPLNWLHNTHAKLESGGSRVYVAGVDQSSGQFGDVGAAIEGIPAGAPVVLLAHYPSTVFDLAPGRVDLVLSGHTHGGQICLPGVGCLFTNDRIPSRMAHGMHRVGDSVVHVTAGVGVSGPIRRRFRCPPEISIITLRAASATRRDESGGRPRRRESFQRSEEFAGRV